MSYFDRTDIKSLENLDLLANQVVEGFIIGLHNSPFHGFSVEFAEHRQYNVGESTKNIDWKVFARTDKLFTKRYEEETNLRCQLVIDISSSMFYPDYPVSDVLSINKYQFSALASAALMNLLKRQRDAFGLSLYGDRVLHHMQPKSSNTQYKLLLNHLEPYISNPPTELTTSTTAAIHEIADRIHRRSLVIIFSDFQGESDRIEALFSAMQHLKFNKHEVILFHVLDKSTEIDFDFQNRPYEFIDKETGQRVRLQPSEVHASYTALMSSYLEKLRVQSMHFNIDYNLAPISEGFYAILRSFLLKRSRMHI